MDLPIVVRYLLAYTNHTWEEIYVCGTSRDIPMSPMRDDLYHVHRTGLWFEGDAAYEESKSKAITIEPLPPITYELSKLKPTNKQLLAWAEKHKPPQKWYNGTDDPFSIANDVGPCESE